MTSLTKCLNQWEEIGANKSVLEWLEFGVKWNFSSEPGCYEFSNRISKSAHKFVSDEVKDLLKKGAISLSKYKPKCVSALTTVNKKGNKLRLVTDLSPLNKHIICPYFKNEGIDTVYDLIQPNDFLISIDLKDGFHHIPVNEKFRTYLGFLWNNKYYLWNVLPFGLNISPYFFNKTVRCVTSYLREKQLRVNFWVDDGLLMTSPNACDVEKLLFINTIEKLGFHINYQKSSLTAETSKEYIGYIVDSCGPNGTPWIKIPNKRINKLKRDLLRILKQKTVKARFLARICGQCISFSKAILPTKLLLRNLYRLLKSKSSWNSYLTLDPNSERDLVWWLSAIKSWNGRPVVKNTIDKQIFTDASSSGWGAVCEGQEASGLWSVQMSYQHSNARELMAVLMALKSFKNSLQNKNVQIMSDNIVTVAYVNHLGGPCPALVKITKAIWAEAFAQKMNLQAKWVAGCHNEVADRLSRLSPYSTYSWSLHPAIFNLLDHMWGPHSFDRFADVTNHLCSLYNSLYFDPLSSGVDALAQQDWGSHNNFVNCPFNLIPKVLQIVLKQNAEATIIAPLWRGQPWFPLLQRMSVRPPILLPNYNVMIFKGIQPEPLKNKKWKILAWRISGKPSL